MLLSTGLQSSGADILSVRSVMLHIHCKCHFLHFLNLFQVQHDTGHKVQIKHISVRYKTVYVQYITEQRSKYCDVVATKERFN